MKQVLDMAIQPPSKINGDVVPEYDAIVCHASGLFGSAFARMLQASIVFSKSPLRL